MKVAIPQRRSIRLPGYDYSSDGLYFVTICTNNRACLFGEIIDAEMHRNGAGRIVGEIWSMMFRFLDDVPTWVVMPNHLHGMVAIENRHRTSEGKSLGRLVGAFKTATTNRAKEMTPEVRLWQRGFYEHIIRDERSLRNILAYIEDNPQRWHQDPENLNSIYSRAR